MNEEECIHKQQHFDPTAKMYIFPIQDVWGFGKMTDLCGSANIYSEFVCLH